jgi:hypothetical protein
MLSDRILLRSIFKLSVHVSQVNLNLRTFYTSRFDLVLYTVDVSASMTGKSVGREREQGTEGHKTRKVTGGWRKLCNGEHSVLCS